MLLIRLLESEAGGVTLAITFGGVMSGVSEGILAAARRFHFLKEHKPKIYNHFMQMGNSGISYREALQVCGIDFPDAMHRQTTINL